jgi:hypothetical protein
MPTESPVHFSSRANLRRLSRETTPIRHAVLGKVPSYVKSGEPLQAKGLYHNYKGQSSTPPQENKIAKK